MREITDIMDHYREVARSLWNTAFWAKPELQTWDARDQFEQIKKGLLKALVIARLEVGHSCDLEALPDLSCQVVPKAPGPVPIMIQRPREGDKSAYWDDPVKEVRASEVELKFLDYFDWDLMAYADFHYYRVRILGFSTQPGLVGREALIEHQHAGVFVADYSPQQASAKSGPSGCF